MKTCSRPTAPFSETPAAEASGLGASNAYEALDAEIDALSEAELEQMLFGEEAEPQRRFLNLPTVAGLSLIGVGLVYLLQEQGLWAGDVTWLVATLPWLAGTLIVLLGMGVLSARPPRRARRKRKKEKKRRRSRLGDLGASLSEKVGAASPFDAKLKKTSRLAKSRRDRKVFGVCGGIGERLGIDPTHVRIAFVLATLFSGGPPFVLAYLALAYFLPDADALTPAERLRIIRES